MTDADLAEQFALALQVRDQVTQANEAVIRIRTLKEQIADRVQRAAATQKGTQGRRRPCMRGDALARS